MLEEHPDLVSELSIKGPPSETSYQEQINMIQTDLSDDTFDGYLIAPLQSESVASLIADTDQPGYGVRYRHRLRQVPGLHRHRQQGTLPRKARWPR